MTTICYKTPKIPAVSPAPTRADVQSTVSATRRATAEQSGTTGNIFTSALGDTTYNENTKKLAKLGGVSP